VFKERERERERVVDLLSCNMCNRHHKRRRCVSCGEGYHHSASTWGRRACLRGKTKKERRERKKRRKRKKGERESKIYISLLLSFVLVLFLLRFFFCFCFLKILFFFFCFCFPFVYTLCSSGLLLSCFNCQGIKKKKNCSFFSVVVLCVFVLFCLPSQLAFFSFFCDTILLRLKLLSFFFFLLFPLPKEKK